MFFDNLRNFNSIYVPNFYVLLVNENQNLCYYINFSEIVTQFIK